MLFIYLISFIIFYKLLNVENKPTFRFILLIYLGSISSSIILWYLYPQYSRKYDLNLIAIFYHITVILFMLFPLRKYDSKINVSKINIKYKSLQPFIIILITLSFISIISSISTFKLIYNAGVSISEGRNDSIMGDSFMRITKPSGSLLAHISAIASEFCYIALFLAFYIKYKFPEKKKTFVLLLISSLSAVIFQLEWFGRENIVRYIFDFILIYLIFKPFISDKFKKSIRKYSLFGIVLILVVFVVITLARFNYDENDKGPIYGVISYFGQGFINFSSFFEAFALEGKSGGKSIFSIFYPVTQRVGIINQSADYGHLYDVPFNAFGTYVATFVNDINAFYSLFVFLILIMFFKLIGKVNSGNIFLYIYMLWIYRFFATGVFYWIDILNNGDRVFSFLIIIILNFIYNYRYKVLKEK